MQQRHLMTHEVLSAHATRVHVYGTSGTGGVQRVCPVDLSPQSSPLPVRSDSHRRAWGVGLVRQGVVGLLHLQPNAPEQVGWQRRRRNLTVLALRRPAPRRTETRQLPQRLRVRVGKVDQHTKGIRAGTVLDVDGLLGTGTGPWAQRRRAAGLEQDLTQTGVEYPPTGIGISIEELPRRSTRACDTLPTLLHNRVTVHAAAPQTRPASPPRPGTDAQLLDVLRLHETDAYPVLHSEFQGG